MSETQTLLLGFIAGVTILIGLPLGKVRAPRPGLRQFLNALAIGILLFLLWDVLVHAFEQIQTLAARRRIARVVEIHQQQVVLPIARHPFDEGVHRSDHVDLVAQIDEQKREGLKDVGLVIGDEHAGRGKHASL